MNECFESSWWDSYLLSVMPEQLLWIHMLQLSHMMALPDLVTALLHIPHGYLGVLGPGFGFMSPHCMRISDDNRVMM